MRRHLLMNGLVRAFMVCHVLRGGRLYGLPHTMRQFMDTCYQLTVSAVLDRLFLTENEVSFPLYTLQGLHVHL